VCRRAALARQSIVAELGPPTDLAVRRAGRPDRSALERTSWRCSTLRAAHSMTCEPPLLREFACPPALAAFAPVPPVASRNVQVELPTARSVAWRSASTWSASDGSGLLTLGASSIQTGPEGSRWIVWMIKRMIKGHPTNNRMALPPELEAG
jgi:hypothetical protein